MFPFQFKDKSKPVIEKDIFSMWFKVVVACIPGAVVTILFDDFIEAHLHTPIVIAITLIVYGIAFIVIERWNKTRTPKVLTLNDITGTARKNVNSAAATLETPINNAPIIVEPEREVPGIIDKI